MEDDDFAKYHFTDDCPMPEGKKCSDPSECGWDWACAIDRAMAEFGTTTIVIERPFPDVGYYHVRKP